MWRFARRTLLISFIAYLICGVKCDGQSKEDYLIMRNSYLEDERRMSLGYELVLSEKESKANDIIMAAKMEEFDRGFDNPGNYTPGQHIFHALEQISASPLFQILQKMPKGGVLHSHNFEMVSSDFIIALTYRDDLWQCKSVDGVLDFLYAREKPNKVLPVVCEWKLVKDERALVGPTIFDEQLRKKFEFFTDNPIEDYPNNQLIWVKFRDIVDTMSNLILYAPNLKDHIRQALEEYRDDGVQYVEIRGHVPEGGVYDLDGNTYSAIDVVEIYKTIADQFVVDNPTFIGVKFIYQGVRSNLPEQNNYYVETITALVERFPTFVIGFDIAGDEVLGPYAKDFMNMLLSIPDHINFYFHSGETNWFGTPADENLIDAVLLGTKRIGHGFALAKHPELLEIIKAEGIAIEVNPISNQVLRFLTDMRNHPCSIFFSNNYPVVISSDDFGIWNVSPMSHDFYEAFLGIAARWQDLRLLKQLALNSLNYSALDEQEKALAMEKWTREWDVFIDNVISSGGNSRKIVLANVLIPVGILLFELFKRFSLKQY